MTRDDGPIIGGVVCDVVRRRGGRLVYVDPRSVTPRRPSLIARLRERLSHG